jgi:hypothetical protein
MLRYAAVSILLGLLLQANPIPRDLQAAELEGTFQYVHGRLSYRRKVDSSERGYEDFWLTRNRDGSRTMRTLAMTHDSQFVRDAIYTLGADERPLLVFIQLQVGEHLIGSGYFRVAGDTMNIVTDSIDSGHTLQTVRVPGRFHVLTHAVMLDGWPVWAFDPALGRDQSVAVYSTSMLWNGTDGPLGRMTTQRFTLLQARHIRFGEDVVSDVWVTGEDNILVKYDWPARGLEYVLVSLTTDAPGDDTSPDR